LLSVERYIYVADVGLLCLLQEIVLSTIMQVKSYTELSSATEDADDAAASLRNPPIFEMHVGADMIYYIGEDPTWGGSKAEVVTSAESGVGLEQARCWESAIRKALMPVTPQPSADFDKGLSLTSLSNI